jgi:CxxC motif-containing protein (DUF1111 family)
LKRPAISRFVAALVLGAVALVALAQEAITSRAPYWPALKGTPMLQEWYSDIPWHQKLGTFAGNEIDAPLILPYEALSGPERTFCTTHNMSPDDCMIELGINNILGMHRIETLYDPTDRRIANAPECKAPFQCTEVRLELSSFWTRSTGSAVALVPEPFGRRYDLGPMGDVYGGYQITDGSTYAPQMLWEMAHYCDSKFPSNGDTQDPVCYGDYLSPMNNGFNPLRDTNLAQWPRSQPWSIFPAAEAPPAGLNQCPEKDTKCVMAMAGFDMDPVLSDSTKLQYPEYNNFLLKWFNNAVASFTDDSHHFPWNTKWSATWEQFIYPRVVLNPFLGRYDTVKVDDANPSNCDIKPDGSGTTVIPCYNTAIRRASKTVYPRLCALSDLASAGAGNSADVDKLRKCGLNYELHHNGFLAQWPESYWTQVRTAGISANQYGRTSFLFAGVPGMQMPVSFYKDPTSDSGMSIYEQVHNASIFSLFLPAANIDDAKNAMEGRNYSDVEFYHTLLMSNHMESDPWQFADGIRGKALWHNEYRTQKMYQFRSENFNPDRTFQAAFDPLRSKYDPSKAPAPFHNNTCDGCHVRNGSGVPINTAYKLDPALQEFMSNSKYVPHANNGVKDYTFTGEIRPMKLVFFDLQPNMARLSSSRYSQPLVASADALTNAPRTVGVNDLYYNNKIMNYYGDSFHVTPPGAAAVFDYAWNYEAANSNRLVVNVARVDAELNKTYQPRQIALGTFQTPSTCQLVAPSPTSRPWPENCSDINGAAIRAAIEGGAVGYMLLNGKRLGNLGVIESIPNQAIIGFRDSQVAELGEAIAGELIWSPGSHGGVEGKVKKDCRTKALTDCYIGRFGWLGDRVSLEDQVANAAFVEMNMTTSEGYRVLYDNTRVANPIRYKYPNCGAANKTCVESKGNSDLSERDIERMADYARWLGNPTRSEIQVSQPEVIAGEKIFRKLQCDTCHAIKRIDIVPDDTMLTRHFRDRVATHIGGTNKPFLSYIGTDLLMHDMGYLSQVGISGQSIRDANGGVKPGFETYVQKVRTPPLKGLRFNNYVTDAHKNTRKAGDPGCDFLLHDGRACSAIEAAFLHDGPAIKKLQVIEGLNGLSANEVLQLRAFLYSL